MNFENEMSQIKGGYWILTEKGWKWVDETNNLGDDDDWAL